jgi:hypothetical protein
VSIGSNKGRVTTRNPPELDAPAVTGLRAGGAAAPSRRPRRYSQRELLAKAGECVLVKLAQRVEHNHGRPVLLVKASDVAVSANLT